MMKKKSHDNIHMMHDNLKVLLKMNFHKKSDNEKKRKENFHLN